MRVTTLKTYIRALITLSTPVPKMKGSRGGRGGVFALGGRRTQPPVTQWRVSSVTPKQHYIPSESKRLGSFQN